VRFRTYTLKFGTSHWVDVTAVDDWGRAADVDARISEDGRTIVVKSENVRALRLRVPLGMLPAGDDPPAVTWHGERVEPESDKAGHLWLALAPPQALDFAHEKTPAVCGPVREAFAGPFVMVWGGDEGGVTHTRALMAARDWLVFAKGEPRIMHADDVTDKIAREHNLILFGTPEDNPLIARAMPHVPVRIEGGCYNLGGKSYDASRNGLWLIHPSPFGKGRAIVINSGPSWGRDLPENHKYDFIPDFMVYADAKATDGTECNEFRVAGFFGQYWQLDPRSTWYADPPEPQDALQPAEPDE